MVDKGVEVVKLLMTLYAATLRKCYDNKIL